MAFVYICVYMFVYVCVSTMVTLLLLSYLFRLMFWLDQSKNPSRIEMSNMDGSNRSTLINLYTKQPVQLTIDTDEDMVYWINGGENGSIEGIRFDGTQHVLVANVSHPFGITAYGGNLFWGSLSTGEISRASKHSIYNKQQMYVNVGAGIPRGLAFVTMDRNGGMDRYMWIDVFTCIKDGLMNLWTD